MAIDGARIQRVTKEGLFYLDDEGEEAFIDFAVCYERQLAKFMEPENLKHHQEINHLSDEDLEKSIERRKNWKVVGERDFSAIPPYMVFYTDPFIRFEFATVDDLQEIRFFIQKKTGWRTYGG